MRNTKGVPNDSQFNSRYGGERSHVSFYRGETAEV